jgi:hypothetical protein
MKGEILGVRKLVAVLVMAFLVTLVSSAARASVSVAVTWDGLLHESVAAAVVTPVEARTVWENGRIYTYTRVHVDRAVAGELAAGTDAWVRTMGGVVGKVGQIVDGEPVLATGRPSLLFLHPGPIGAYEVTARGQGQFPVVTEDPKVGPRVVRNRSVGALVPRPAGVVIQRLAAEALHDRPVEDVARDVAADWDRTHAP